MLLFLFFNALGLKNGMVSERSYDFCILYSNIFLHSNMILVSILFFNRYFCISGKL